MVSSKKNLFSLFVTVFLDFLGFSIILPVIAPVLLDPVHGVLTTDASYSQRTVLLGLLIAAFPVAQFFGAPVLGVLSDKYGRKKILLVSIGCTALSLLLFGVGIELKSLALLLVSRMLNGLMGGNVSTAQSAIADMSDIRSKARNFGLIGMAFGMGFVLGPFIGGKLADPHTVSWFTFSTPFWFAGGLSALNVLLIGVWFRETLQHPNPEVVISFLSGMRNLRRAFSHPLLGRIFTVVFFAMFGFTFFTQFFQVFLITKFQYDQAHIGMLYAYMGLWIAFTQGVVVRVLTRNLASRTVLVYSLPVMGVFLLSLLVPEDSRYLYALLPVVSMAQGVSAPNLTALISNAAGPREQGETLGINQSITAVAYAVPPVLAGLVTALDFRLPLVLAGFCTFTAWVLFLRGVKE